LLLRHVIDLLSECKKPIIGHNMLLDLVQLYAHFWGEPPEKVEDFASEVNGRLGTVIDTKYMIHGSEILSKLFTGGSRLDWVFKHTASAPFTHPAIR
jgi:poly(A)-specific ribonuclease